MTDTHKMIRLAVNDGGVSRHLDFIVECMENDLKLFGKEIPSNLVTTYMEMIKDEVSILRRINENCNTLNSYDGGYGK